MENDSQFKQAFQYVEDHITDTIEGVSLQMSLQPAREGFQDRRLQLQARRPEKYNPRTTIDLDITLKVDPNNAGSTLRNLLSSNAITADYEVID
jgi:hypothetical protein